MRRFLLIAAVFAVVLLYGLTVATGSSNVLSDYFWWIVALCGLLLLVLAAVLVRYVVLLMRDNSKSVFGSQIARSAVGDVYFGCRIAGRVFVRYFRPVY